MPEQTKSYDGTKIKAVPKPEINIGIDTEHTLATNLVNSYEYSAIDMSVLDSFLNVSQNREQIYKLIDTMAQDSTIASVLETYAEDAVETNEQGRVMWVESSDGEVAKLVSHLLDVMNVDKHAYNWVYNLIKYGDLYLRLFRESDYKDEIFNAERNVQNKLNEAATKVLLEEQIEDFIDLDEEVEKKTLNEDVIVKVNSKNDPLVGYVEAVRNPAEMYELVKHGKTMGYIEAPIQIAVTNSDPGSVNYYRYKMKKRDVTVYEADEFVHACLEDNSSRTPEEVNIFLEDKDYNSNSNAKTYTVKRGQSLLYNLFKIWRELSLLENSVLLNRITKSAIVRMIQIEVGDMGKEDVMSHLRDIKSMVEQKSSINTGKSMSEYTNPGPIENNIYIPTRNGKGAITPQQIGGDIDVKGLADLEYFRDKIFAALRVPKQFFGFTDDAAGFNGGTSLSIISSRYGKAVKRIQNTLIQVITDAINIMLLDRGLYSYINKFRLRMSAPITQEEIDKRENSSNKIRLVSDIMGQLTDIENIITKLKILKALLTNVVQDEEVIALIQDEIDSLEEQLKESQKSDNKDKTEGNMPVGEEGEEDSARNVASDAFENELFGGEDMPAEGEESESGEIAADLPLDDSGESDDDYLPSGSELGVNLTNM